MRSVSQLTILTIILCPDTLPRSSPSHHRTEEVEEEGEEEILLREILLISLRHRTIRRIMREIVPLRRRGKSTREIFSYCG